MADESGVTMEPPKMTQFAVNMAAARLADVEGRTFEGIRTVPSELWRESQELAAGVLQTSTHLQEVLTGYQQSVHFVATRSDQLGDEFMQVEAAETADLVRKIDELMTTPPPPLPSVLPEWQTSPEDK